MKRVLKAMDDALGKDNVKAYRKVFFKIHLKVSAEEMDLDVEESDTIEDVVTRLSQKLKFPKSGLLLWHRFQCCEQEDKPIGFYGIVKGCTVEVYFGEPDDPQSELNSD